MIGQICYTVSYRSGFLFAGFYHSFTFVTFNLRLIHFHDKFIQ
ncbi:hypothetical protein BH20BAC1_BH20BAC1_09260 [soil metagenome]